MIAGPTTGLPMRSSDVGSATWCVRHRRSRPGITALVGSLDLCRGLVGQADESHIHLHASAASAATDARDAAYSSPLSAQTESDISRTGTDLATAIASHKTLVERHM